MDELGFWYTIAHTGTNEWIKDFVMNNYYIVGPVIALGATWLKGKYPEFFAKLSTIIPFVGDHRKLGG